MQEINHISKESMQITNQDLTKKICDSISRIHTLLTDETILLQFNQLQACIINCFEKNGKVLIFGNGGFASISQHFAAELQGRYQTSRKPLAALSLTSDVSVISCIANDFGYERIFSRQIEAIAQSDDLIIGLSASGKSRNILEALSVASELGINSFMITGANCPDLVDHLCNNIIRLPLKDTALIQDTTMIIFHSICEEIEKWISYTSTFNWDNIIDYATLNNCHTLILDRDGVINKVIPNGYVLRNEDLCFNQIFLNNCKKLSQTFKKIFIVTNQACIGKGIATRAQIDEVSSYVEDILLKNGCQVTATYICPDAASNSKNRKPNIGMAELLNEEYPDVKFTQSIIIGDSYSDYLFAKALGATFFKINQI